MRGFYELFGARYPVFSLIVMIVLGALIGALLLGGNWWSIGQQVKRDQVVVRLQGQLEQLRSQLDERTRNQANRSRLAQFLQEGEALISRCIGERGSDEVAEAVEDWRKRTTAFLASDMGTADVARFNSLGDLVFVDAPTGFPAAKLGLYNSIRGRVRRLTQFIEELRD